MRLLTFVVEQRRRTGVVVDDYVVDLQAAYEAMRHAAGLPPAPHLSATLLPDDLVGLIAQWDVAADIVHSCVDFVSSAASDRQQFNEALRAYGQAPVAYALDEITFVPPLVRPGKVLGIGLNYKDHAEETGKPVPSEPMFFNKFPTSLIGHNAAIVHPSPALTTKVDFEAELAVVIGRTVKNVAESAAMDYVFGYTIMNDVSARDLQYADGQFVKGKALDTFGPMGPWILAAESGDGARLDPHDMSVTLRLNGEVMQSGHTSQMIFSVPKLIAYLSRLMTLEPGDVIMTGTPAGVGVARNPQRFLQPGDVVEIDISGIGRLRNEVVAASDS